MPVGPLPRDSGARAGRTLAANGRAGLLCAAAITACVVVAYAPGLRAPFVFDDIGALAGNDSLRHGWASLASLNPPSGGITVTGRPFLNVSFAVDYAVCGLDPWGYHLTNLAIHLLAAACLFGLLRRSLEPQGRVRDWALAAAATLLWALHPLQTESVTYLSQRAESLMGLCYLFTLYAFRRGVDEDRPAWLAASGAACLLGMGTKEVMVSAPLIVLAYDRCCVSGGWRAALRARTTYYAALALTWGLLAFEVLRGHGRGGTLGFNLGLSWPTYLYGQAAAIAHYLRLSLWPSPLVFDYGVVAPAPLLGAGGVGVLVTAALAAATVVAWRRKPAAGFLGLFVFAILAPTSLVPGNRQTWAEHRMYLALAPLCVVAALVLARAGARFLWAAAAIGVLLGAVTFARDTDYRSALALWSDTAAKAPGNAFAWYNLGEAQLSAGRPGPAADSFRAAIAIAPGYAQAHNNLGNALALTGKPQEALKEFTAAATLAPGSAEMSNNLGNALLAARRFAEADAAFARAIRADPLLETPHLGLAQSLIGQQDLSAAQDELQAAVRLAPADPLPRARLARVWLSQGRTSDAIEQFRAAAALSPEEASVHFNLANALAGARRFDEAIAEYEVAARLSPGDARLHASFGTALLLSGQRARAKEEYEKALEIDPGLDRVRERLRWLAAQ